MNEPNPYTHYTVTPENDTADLDEKVKITVNGLATVSEALVNDGAVDLISNDLQGFENYLKKLNEQLASTARNDSDVLTPELLQVIEAVQGGLGSSAFRYFLWDLGAMDTMCLLKANDNEKPHDLSFRIIGFD